MTYDPSKFIAVYAFENENSKPEYKLLAAELGDCIAKRGLGLVYGGTKKGLMAEVARHVLAAGGKVIGVVSQEFPDDMIMHGLTELIRVEDLGARKKTMTHLSCGSIVLPSGLGGVEEFATEATDIKVAQKFPEQAAKMGNSTGSRPIVFLDNDGYWHPMLQALFHMGHAKGNDKDLSFFRYTQLPGAAVLAAMGKVQLPKLEFEVKPERERVRARMAELNRPITSAEREAADKLFDQSMKTQGENIRLHRTLMRAGGLCLTFLGAAGAMTVSGAEQLIAPAIILTLGALGVATSFQKSVFGAPSTKHIVKAYNNIKAMRVFDPIPRDESQSANPPNSSTFKPAGV